MRVVERRPGAFRPSPAMMLRPRTLEVLSPLRGCRTVARHLRRGGVRSVGDAAHADSPARGRG